MTDPSTGLRDRIAAAVTSAASDGRTVENPWLAADAVLGVLFNEVERLTAYDLLAEDALQARAYGIRQLGEFGQKLIDIKAAPDA